MRWNILKNLVLILALALAYPEIQREFSAVTDTQTLNTLLLFIGLIIVAPLFANFQFSYQFSHKGKFSNILSSHIATFLAMLVIGLLIEMVDVIFVRLVGNIVIFRLTLLAFMTCMIVWDCWDYWRLEKK